MMLFNVPINEEDLIITANPLRFLWWKFLPGKTIFLPWPNGYANVILYDKNSLIQSSDPNDHYRPWLEENVGRQGIDWDWSIYNGSTDGIIIKFRIGKTQWATAAALMWR